MAQTNIRGIQIKDTDITTADIADGAVTLAKVQNINTNKLLGRTASGSGIIEEITVGGSLTLSSGILSDVETFTPSSADTLSNKRITKRVVTVSQSATPAINTDNGDIFSITGLAQAITSFSVSGSPSVGDMIMIQITDNATARAITWGASFGPTTVPLPTTTSAATMLRVLFQKNNVWDCIGVV